ncbi:unnamed protein product [Owenia fusiformis]|uniref:G-protein coupled receptors family 1 profile domain-containing protein n=1 Tax=Owenia fusiformis TaxID=6347 RepID=A0A8S4NJA3_OWEFU|nr:unnamed protein product [Owenia fusiformis]
MSNQLGLYNNNSDEMSSSSPGPEHFESTNESTTVAFAKNLTEYLHNHELLGLEASDIIILTLYCLLSLLICGSNLPVLISIVLFKKLRSAKNMFLVSLAMSDICIGALDIPLYVISRYMSPIIFEGVVQNEYICIAECYSKVCLQGASLLSMVGIAIDRFIAVTKPLRYKEIVTRSRALWFIAVCWLYLVGVSSFMFYKRVDTFDEFKEKCASQVFNQYYKIFVNVNIFILFLVFVVSHIVVAIVAVKHRSKHIQALSKIHNTLAVAYVKEIRLVKTMTIVVALSAMCWLPFVIGWIFHDKSELDLFNKFFRLLLCSNSAMNPWIYAFRIKELNAGMRRVVLCRFKAHQTLNVSPLQ